LEFKIIIELANALVASTVEKVWMKSAITSIDLLASFSQDLISFGDFNYKYLVVTGGYHYQLT